MSLIEVKRPLLAKRAGKGALPSTAVIPFPASSSEHAYTL